MHTILSIVVTNICVIGMLHLHFQQHNQVCTSYFLPIYSHCLWRFAQQKILAFSCHEGRLLIPDVDSLYLLSRFLIVLEDIVQHCNSRLYPVLTLSLTIKGRTESSNRPPPPTTYVPPEYKPFYLLINN